MKGGDKVVEVRATEVPGMRIRFSGPVSPDGVGVEFEMIADRTIHKDDLNADLDKVYDAQQRLSAREELPRLRQSLAANIKLLSTAERDRARHNAQLEARVQRVSANRRNEVEPNPQDINALAQHDTRIMQISEQIERARARVPYLEAIIAGREPPDLFPDSGTQMAAQ